MRRSLRNFRGPRAYKFFCFLEAKLLYGVALVSTVHQSESALLRKPPGMAGASSDLCCCDSQIQYPRAGRTRSLTHPCPHSKAQKGSQSWAEAELGLKTQVSRQVI